LNEVKNTEHQISSKKKEIQNQEKVVKRYQNEVASLKKELNDKQDKGKKIRSNAQKIAGAYVKPNGTVHQLNAKIKQIRESRKKSGNDRLLGEKDVLFKDYKAVKDQYSGLETKIQMLNKNVDFMEQMDQNRQNNFLFIRDTITKIVQRRFAMLSETFSKQFGTQIFINVSHKKRELSFIFKNSEGDSMDTDINSLSGGEKSYAQMCLIAALWENMNPPFRALDEWDVFLDAINRKSISKTLLNFGLSKLDYQFIFISPQGASDISFDKGDAHKVAILEVKKK